MLAPFLTRRLTIARYFLHHTFFSKLKEIIVLLIIITIEKALYKAAKMIVEAKRAFLKIFLIKTLVKIFQTAKSMKVISLKTKTKTTTKWTQKEILAAQDAITTLKCLTVSYT